MFKKYIPNLGAQPGPSFTKRSRANLDNVLNSLILLVNLSSYRYSGDLISSISSIHAWITSTLIMDSKSVIPVLKSLSVWYLSHIRGSKSVRGEIPESLWNPESLVPTILEDTVAFRTKWTLLDDIDIFFFDQIVYAALSLHRVLVGELSPNYNTITEPPTMSHDMKHKCYISVPAARGYLRKLGIDTDNALHTLKQMSSTFHYEILTSKGPNGPQGWTAFSDACAWMSNMGLLATLTKWCRGTGLLALPQHLRAVSRIKDSDLGRKGESVLSRLVLIGEWGFKTRIVAQLDYWTQMALTPLHRLIASYLKQLPNDGTFNQTQIAERVRFWTQQPELQVYSVDLTAATDRIPIEIYKVVLTALLGSKDLAEYWATILVNRDFITPEGEAKRYGTGQPMGARSSFPLLGLIHHIIVAHAAHIAGINDYVDYVILGDDNTMTGCEVASAYKEILSYYGIGISASKSVEFEHGTVSAGEICKRIFLNGRELTMVPVKLIAKTVSEPILSSTLQDTMVERGLDTSVINIFDFISGIINKTAIHDHIKLNILPREVTGLIHPNVPTGLEAANPRTWFTDIALTVTDIINAYTYTLVVAQLQRLDALIRSTLALSSAITLRTHFAEEAGKWRDSPDAFLTAFEIPVPSGKTKGEVFEEAWNLPSLSPTHPITLASTYEVARITNEIHKLMANDQAVVTSARKGLLDAFRNALTDSWQPDEVALAQATRTLVTKTLRNIEVAASPARHAPPGSGPVGFVQYTVMLQSIQKLWTVRWDIGGHVSINAVVSKVDTSTSAAKSKAALAVTTFDVFGSSSKQR